MELVTSFVLASLAASRSTETIQLCHSVTLSSVC